MSNPLKGVQYLLRGFKLLGQPGIRQWVMMPVLISLLVLTLMVSFLLQWVATEWQALVPDYLQWLAVFILPLILLMLILAALYGFTIVANMISAPFNGLLAAAVERHLTGKSPEEAPQESVSLLRQLPRLLLAEIRKMLYWVTWLSLAGLLFIIPVIQLIAPLVWFLLGAWLFVIEYADFPMGNHGIAFVQQRAYLRQQRLLVLGLGSASVILSLVPILNLFAMPATVAATTLWWVESGYSGH